MPPKGSMVDDWTGISADRAGRLYRLLKQVANTGPTSRPQLLKRLKVGMRTFYRDIDLLRGCGIIIHAEPKGYTLQVTLDEALAKLPFPNPELTFGDVLQLIKGRSSADIVARAPPFD